MMVSSLEDDCIRVHPIMTQGGTLVNAMPEKICIEGFVRGKTLEAIEIENQKVNHDLCGGALSLGANIEICDIPRYAPLINDQKMINIADKAVKVLSHDQKLRKTRVFSTGSADIGDLCCIMPVVHPYAPLVR